MENEFVEYDFRMISIKPAHPLRALSSQCDSHLSGDDHHFSTFSFEISRALTIKQNIHQGSAGIPG